MGATILEVVCSPEVPTGDARFWGLVVTVADLDALAERLGPALGNVRPAVQPGRRIATARRAAGLGTRVAFMSPAAPR
jgi:sensor domain CHASE-containing protein